PLASILVVEDEALVRQMLTRSLRRLGYRVVEATSGVDALLLWPDIAGGVDLVLTDMVMPGGVSGTDLAASLREQKPGIEIIVMSGHSAKVGNERDAAAHGVRFMSKPFSLATLRQTVLAALGAERPSRV
ncbi:MAG TPA: response regulator, partial [Gemmatimonadaceae bacterium]|nr:response regulator [Gemmatimonadaceae bacterium]